jgi:amino acid permease
MPKFGMFTNLVIILNGFGTATSLLIASSDFILFLIKNVLSSNYTGIFLEKRFWITMEILIVIPIVFRKSLVSLKSFSLFSIISISYLTFSIICSYFILNEEQPTVNPKNFESILEQPEPELGFLQKIFKSFMAVSIIIFAYGCQQNSFQIYSELKPSHRPFISHVFFYAILFSTVIYLIVGYCGYATFGDHVESNILNNYDESNIIINIARLAMAVYCTFTYSIQMHPCRESIKKEIISFRIRHQRDYGDINENGDQNEKAKLLIIDPNQNYGTTSDFYSRPSGSGSNNTNSNSCSTNTSSNNIASYDEDDEFESQFDANDADDERSSDSHQIKHINIDILDNLAIPVSTTITDINNYDTKTLFNCITIVLLISSYLFAMICNDFGKVLSIVGATCCTTLTFILPGYLYVKITRGLTFKRLQAITLLLLGGVIGVIGTIASL